jgi:hypothetical protein
LAALGFDEWMHDKATLVKPTLLSQRLISRMAFNYQFSNEVKLEMFTYEGVSHHHEAGRVGSDPFLSHMSTYVDDAVETATFYCDKMGLRVVHHYESYNHTNKVIAGKKRFREVMIGTRHLFGYDVKFLQTLTEGPWEIE